MPTLDWIGKKAVIKHHKEVPYRLLEPVAELSHGDPDSGNLIVQGDNLLPVSHRRIRFKIAKCETETRRDYSAYGLAPS